MSKATILTPQADPSNAMRFNLNQLNNQIVFDVREFTVAAVQAFAPGWATAVLQVYQSIDGATPFSLSPVCTLGPGSADSGPLDTRTTAYLIVRVTTPEGSALLGQIAAIGRDTPYGPKGDTGASGATVKTMAADQSINSSTTLTNVTDLAWSIGAGENWTYTAKIRVSGFFTTTGLKVAVTVPTGATLLLMGKVYTETAPVDVKIQTVTASGTPIAISDGDFGNDAGIVELEFSVANGVNAGTVQVQFAQSTSVGDNLTFKAGSFGVGFKK